MESAEMILLYDYYGDMLTDRQRECFELRYYQDLSLGEIGQELGISRQGVFDNLSRTEALLKKWKKRPAVFAGISNAAEPLRRFPKLPANWRSIPIQPLQNRHSAFCVPWPMLRSKYGI